MCSKWTYIYFSNSEISISIGKTVYHFVIAFIFIAPDSEETLSDECPLEEVPVSA